MNERFIPEEQFADTPKQFSGFSKIILKKKPDDVWDGIILDNIKEVEGALRLYNGEADLVPGSEATSMDLFKNMGQQGGLMGIGLAVLSGASAQEGRDFVGTMVQAIRCSLAESGRYHVNYDYDAMGTNFLKTTVEVETLDDKLILKINAAFVGREPEKSLAKKMKKNMALSSVSAGVTMSVVDDWWFNINLKEMLQKAFPISDKDFKKMANDVCEGYRARFIYQADEGPIAITISIECSRHFYLQKRRSQHSYLYPRGYCIVGAAWDGSRDRDTLARAKPPVLVLSFSYYSRDHQSGEISSISPKQMKFLRKFRDELAEKIKI
jgi:hypothetical protein